MSNETYVQKFVKSDKRATPPKWLLESDAVHYETLMGSHAYGTYRKNSDYDVYGFCIPPVEYTFPHTAGYLPDFDPNYPKFEQYQQNSLFLGKKEYDIQMYSIVKYFRLTMDCNPNMIDSLFTPVDCILTLSPIANVVRENREIFLSKKAYHSFRGYAFSQLNRVESRKNSDEYKAIIAFENEYGVPHTTTYEHAYSDMMHSFMDDELISEYRELYDAGMNKTKRFEDIKINGTDTKFLYHTIRLLLECEQILRNSDINLRRDKEYLKAIRNGAIPFDDIKEYNDRLMIELQDLYKISELRHTPDIPAVKSLLFDCLEEHYGSLNEVGVSRVYGTNELVAQIEKVLRLYK